MRCLVPTEWSLFGHLLGKLRNAPHGWRSQIILLFRVRTWCIVKKRMKGQLGQNEISGPAVASLPRKPQRLTESRNSWFLSYYSVIQSDAGIALFVIDLWMDGYTTWRYDDDDARYYGNPWKRHSCECIALGSKALLTKDNRSNGLIITLKKDMLRANTARFALKIMWESITLAGRLPRRLASQWATRENDITVLFMIDILKNISRFFTTFFSLKIHVMDYPIVRHGFSRQKTR